MKKKKSSQVEISSAPMDGPQKRSFSVNEAENGFTVNHSGGDLGYQGKTHVFRSGDEVVAHLNAQLGAKGSKKSENPEKDRKSRQRAEAEASVKESYEKSKR